MIVGSNVGSRVGALINEQPFSASHPRIRGALSSDAEATDIFSQRLTLKGKAMFYTFFKRRASLMLASLAFMAVASFGLLPGTATAQVTGTCISGCTPTTTSPSQGAFVWGGFQTATASQSGADGKGAAGKVLSSTWALGESNFIQGVDLKSTVFKPGSPCVANCATDRAILSIVGEMKLGAGAHNSASNTAGPAQSQAVTGTQGTYLGGVGLRWVAPTAPAGAPTGP